MEENKKTIARYNNSVLKDALGNPYVKIGLYIGAGLLLIYAAGHAMKVISFTKNSFNQMKATFKK